MSRLAHVALLVPDYDDAIAWFTSVLDFTLVADEDRGGGKRWVLVAPLGGHGPSVLLARAATDQQRAEVGRQAGERVAFFLHTDDFARDHATWSARGVRFTEGPRQEAYGTVAVFLDCYGNRWDLIEPSATARTGHVIEQEFPIKAAPERVFAAISSSAGLDAWWTLTSACEPAPGATYALGFGPEYQWVAIASVFDPSRAFELTMTTSDDDWRGSRVRFDLSPTPLGTSVRFTHAGWPEAHAHYRTSAHCWALYLRLLRRYVETGHVVPYDDRLDA